MRPPLLARASMIGLSPSNAHLGAKELLVVLRTLQEITRCHHAQAQNQKR